MKSGKTANSELISELKLKPEEQFIINCLRTEFSKNGYDKIGDVGNLIIDWDVVFRTTMQMGVTPLIYKIIENHPSFFQLKGVPIHVMRKLAMMYIRTFHVNHKRFEELGKVLESFYSLGIKVILLKGGHLAQFVYQDVGLRPMCDIDILVRKEDLQKTIELLFQIGFGVFYEKQARYIERCKDCYYHISPHFRHFPSLIDPKKKMKLDVHFSLVKQMSPFNIDIDGLWERSRKAETNGTKALLLSPEDLLLHISIHNSYNHKFKFVGLKTICDTAQTLNHYGTEIDWDLLKSRAYDWEAQKSLYLTLRLSQEILGGIIVNGILDDLKPESCSQKIVSEAKHRIFSSETKVSPYAHMPTDFHPDNSLLKRVYCIFKTIFIPPENLAALYKLPLHSKRVYFYYPIRLISVLYKKVPQYTPLFVSLLIHKKKDVVQNDFDLWLISKGPGN